MLVRFQNSITLSTDLEKHEYLKKADVTKLHKSNEESIVIKRTDLTYLTQFSVELGTSSQFNTRLRKKADYFKIYFLGNVDEWNLKLFCSVNLVEMVFLSF